MSIKILHTSDWHLGKVFKESNFELLPIQRQVISELIDITRKEEPDMIIIAGDIFDSYNPPFEAERLFYETLSKLSRQSCFVFVVAGNHDSPEKLQIARPLIDGIHPLLIKALPIEESDSIAFENKYFKLEKEGSFFKLRVKDRDRVVALKCLPYISEFRLGLSGDDYLLKLQELLSEEPQFTCDFFILVGHLSMLGAQKSGSERIFQIGGVEFVPSDFLPKNVHYIALGHLHRYQKVRNAVYSGSIYPFDIGEVEHEKGVCLWNNGQLSFMNFKKIPSIRKLEFNSIQEAIKLVPDEDAYYYIMIKDPSSYSPSSVDSLMKVYKNKLINWRFSAGEVFEESVFPDLSSLNEEEMFIEFYRAKLHSEPSREIIELFLKTLQEVKNASS